MGTCWATGCWAADSWATGSWGEGSTGSAKRFRGMCFFDFNDYMYFFNPNVGG